MISKICLQILGLCSLGTLTSFTVSLPVTAAEEIDFFYSPIEEFLKVSSLEKFVADGTIDKNLEFYLNIAQADEEKTALFRKLLTTKIPVDPVVISRLLKTDEGERLLNFFGNVINIQGGGNGKIPLRGAIVTAALDKEEGLTLLNFLLNLSVDVQIDVQKAIALAKDIGIIVDGTEKFVDEVAKLSAQEAQQSENIDFSQLPDLRKAGNYAFEEKTWNLNDSKRNRKFYVTVYQPKQWRAGKTPVVVFSHGLNSKPAHYAEKAEHLANMY